MPSNSLPTYVKSAKPNPTTNRSPWYTNIAPSYAGVFLWIGYYQGLGTETLSRVGLAGCILGLVFAGLISYALFYYVPAILGMKTGHPLYIVGTSTFGTHGGYLMPGLLMGLLQIGWFAVGTFFATRFILTGIGLDSTPMTLPFALVSVLWAYSLAYIAIKGIHYVGRVATIFNLIPALIILFVFAKTSPGIPSYLPENPATGFGILMTIQVVVGFFATAGAAGTDFGMNSRTKKDIILGGLLGIAVPIILVGTLTLGAVAGAHGLNTSLPDFQYGTTVASVGGSLASIMFLLFAVASIAPGCFSTFIAANSFETMLPRIPRLTSTMIAVTLAAILSITGIAANLVGFFTVVGASFGPICGAMAADYLLSNRSWAGPRKGVNIAGYGAWAFGFVVGILPLPFIPLAEHLKSSMQPAVVYSFLTGFIIYIVLAKLGLEPSPVNIEVSSQNN